MNHPHFIAIALCLVACARSQGESAGAPMVGVSPASPPAPPTPRTSGGHDDRFAFRVSTSQGATEFRFDDLVTIDEVWGTANGYQVGASYRIVGRYRLASGKRASLAAGVTATGPASRGVSPHRSAQLLEGTGRFALELTIGTRGYPHLTLYSEKGDTIGGVYFGKDEWLLPSKDWSYSTPTPDHVLPDPRANEIRPL